METDREKLLQQAPGAAHQYLNRAVEAIDKTFGKGYAKSNPNLVSALMLTAAADYHAEKVARAITRSQPT